MFQVILLWWYYCIIMVGLQYTNIIMVGLQYTNIIMVVNSGILMGALNLHLVRAVWIYCNGPTSGIKLVLYDHMITYTIMVLSYYYDIDFVVLKWLWNSLFTIVSYHYFFGANVSNWCLICIINMIIINVLYTI